MYLVSVETVKIKDFIFNTNKLKTIRGASFLLDYLNQVVVKDILSKNGVEDNDILYIAAGNAKFYCKDEEVAKKIETEIKEVYNSFAPDSKLAISYIDAGDQKIWDAMDKLAKETNIVKNKGFSKINLDLPFIEKCSICCDNPVQIKKENFNENLENYVKNFEPYLERENSKENINEKLKTLDDRYKIKKQIFDKDGVSGICPSCFAKYIAANLIKEDFQSSGFYSKFKENFKDDFRPVDSLEEYKLKKSFIGFMYSDGDSVGEFLKNAKNNFQDEKKYKEFIKKFSQTLDDHTKDSLIEVLKELRKEDKLDEHFGEFLIVGGDDVCAVFPGHIVMEVSTRFQERFNSKMKDYYKACNFKNNGSNITSSGGVIIAKAKTPMYYLFDQSLTLQKNAKKKRYEVYEGKSVDFKNGFIDFQVIGSEGTVNIGDFRKGVKNLIQRPYSIEDIDSCKKIDSLLQLIESLKASNFPKNKLRMYYDLKAEIEKNPNKSMENLFELINTIVKLDSEQKELILSWIGKENLSNSHEDTLKEILNNIFDVIELYDFVGGSK
ncbi:Cas10/Cmr2 second palm domain-containing protein [Cetobacterium sp.]|uniref:Cas10/Cmr2 second palm domain-containing protein n=1 Tax=Cetobacterium sp. TaxID=2071632 RepID=UPI003F3A6752